MNPFPVDLSTEESIDTFVGALEPYIPYSLPILGYVFHSDGPGSDKINNTSNSARYSTPKVQIWSSESDLKVETSRQGLFSIVLFSESDSQFRFFCSAEASGSSPTPEQQAHVKQMLGSVMKSVVRSDPKYRTIVPLPRPPSADDADEITIFIGSVHGMWASVLQPHSLQINPCHLKYIYSPANSTLSPSDRETPSLLEANGWTISQLQPSEADLVKVTSGVSRSRDYLVGRCSSSVCIRDVNGSAPVAWALIHSDGSIGALYVQPGHRRRGLAHLVVRELARKRTIRAGEEGIDMQRTYGTLGWNWTDVAESNDKSRRFMESLGGWNKEWGCYWLYLTSSMSA